MRRPALAELWGQEVSEATAKDSSLGKWKDDCWSFFFFSLPHHIPSSSVLISLSSQRRKFQSGTSSNLRTPETEWAIVFTSKHLEINEFRLWHGWSVRLIPGIINKMNQCQESDQLGRNVTQERGKNHRVQAQCMPALVGSQTNQITNPVLKSWVIWPENNIPVVSGYIATYYISAYNCSGGMAIDAFTKHM